jgi:integrase
MPKKRGNQEGTIVRRKDGRWMASLTIGRNPTTGKLKRAYFYGKTRQEAADQLARALSDLGRGLFVAPHKLTVGEWLNTWLREYKQPRVRPLTFDNYERVIRCHLIPALGHIPLQDLRPQHVQRFYNEKRQAGMAENTLRVLHVVLHMALMQALRNQLVTRNVSEATEPPSGKSRPPRPLTLAQIGQLLAAIADDRLYPAILLGFATGLRRGELLALRWQDVNLEAGLIQVRQKLVRVSVHDAAAPRRTRLVFQEPKTEQSRRTLPIHADVVETLRQHKARQAEEKLLMGQGYEDHGLVFCGANGRPLDPVNFYRHFLTLLRRVGLPRSRVHDIRHAFATTMRELGESPKTVQTMLGHASIKTTLDIYSHVSLDLEKQAAARLNAALREAATSGYDR